MNVYRRYFRVTSGPVTMIANEARKVNAKAAIEYSKIMEEIGAGPGYYHRDHRLVAMVFKERPDPKLYKRVDNGWYPKQNTKFGRALHKRFEAVKTIGARDCIDDIGIPYPGIFSGGRVYFPTMVTIPSVPLVVMLTIPWMDKDPEELLLYQNDDDTFDATLDALLWEPSSDMEEIKEWQMKKEIDDWNESIKVA